MKPIVNKAQKLENKAGAGNEFKLVVEKIRAGDGSRIHISCGDFNHIIDYAYMTQIVVPSNYAPCLIVQN